MALTCPSCGAANAEGAISCTNCGGDLRTPVAPPQPVEPPRVPPPPQYIPPPGSLPPAAAPGPYAADPYAQTPPQWGAGASAPPSPQQYGYGPAPAFDANTSGMGAGYPLPPETQGWTFAGCVPFGLFGFFNGIMLWGVLGLVGIFIPFLHLIAAIVLGIKGREYAWQSRRFYDVEQFRAVMGAWNTWGIVLLILHIIWVAVIITVYIAVIAGMVASGAFNTPPGH